MIQNQNFHQGHWYNHTNTDKTYLKIILSPQLDFSQWLDSIFILKQSQALILIHDLYRCYISPQQFWNTVKKTWPCTSSPCDRWKQSLACPCVAHLPGMSGRHHSLGIILGMGSANERRRYIVTPSLIGRVPTQNDPCCGSFEEAFWGLSNCLCHPLSWRDAMLSCEPYLDAGDTLTVWVLTYILAKLLWHARGHYGYVNWCVYEIDLDP